MLMVLLHEFKTEKAMELILMPKVFFTFKELKSKISIPFSFLSKYWKLEKKTILFGLREDRRLMVEFESLVRNCVTKF